MNTDIKILAPAGSWETLRAAINAGCDEVYLGIAGFNMRATAARNFKIEELSKIVDYCHEHKVKVNITVNTVLYDTDLSVMRKVIDASKDAGVDAVIVADMAALQYAVAKGVSAHISTQVSISNIESVKFYSKYADRMILARELNLNQIKDIVRAIEEEDIRGPKGELVAIEVFAHGAMCVAVSGRCWLSLYGSGTSANKGQCSQMCRRKYQVVDIETGKEMIVDNNYVFSAADLCTIAMLPELLDTGVKVLKFEGRGRSPEYVDTVISVYKEALQSIKDENYDDERIGKWREKLETVFNRGQSEGLYRGLEFARWSGSRGSRATEEKFLIGKVEKFYPKISVAQVKILADDCVNEGDKFSITSDKTGIVRGNLKGMMIDEEAVQEACQGDVITFKVDGRVRKDDKFFILRKRKSFVPRGRDLK